MRCLTLADVLRERGVQCHFICRAHPGHLGDFIQQRGHDAILLPLQSGSPSVVTVTQTAHAAWLGAGITQEMDAHDTLAAIDDCVGKNPIAWWMVVDHYALDQHWEGLLRSACQHLMVVDDLADRPHNCDLLLDQNLGRQEADYAELIPAHATKLIGPSYALLRPEFAQWRPYSLQRRAEHPGLRHLLITMGGVDKDDVTGKVLQAIASKPLINDVRITVVMGANAPWLDHVRRLAADMPHPTEVVCGVSNMAQLMAEADLAIGAAGGTAWERCCLGLPSLILVLAANQEAGANALLERKAVLVPHVVEQIPSMLLELSQPCISNERSLLSVLSEATRFIADGTGALRVVDTMSVAFTLSGPVARKMQESDLAMVLSWRNDPSVRQHMLTQHEISLEEHTNWFAQASKDPTRRLLIVEEEKQPLGYVQFSNIQSGVSADWGFYAVPGAPKGSGRKLGLAALAYAFEDLGIRKVYGQVLTTNLASIAFHESLGFEREDFLRDQCFIHGQQVGMICYRLLASGWDALKG